MIHSPILNKYFHSNKYLIDIFRIRSYTIITYSNIRLNDKGMVMNLANETVDFCCDINKVQEIKVLMNDIKDVELVFKALADATRLKIAYALTLTEELCVADVARVIDASTATASHHLRLLHNMKLAKSRKEGKLVFYSLDDDHVRQLVYIAMVHAKEGKENG